MPVTPTIRALFTGSVGTQVGNGYTDDTGFNWSSDTPANTTLDGSGRLVWSSNLKSVWCDETFTEPGPDGYLVRYTIRVPASWGATGTKEYLLGVPKSAGGVSPGSSNSVRIGLAVPDNLGTADIVVFDSNNTSTVIATFTPTANTDYTFIIRVIGELYTIRVNATTWVLSTDYEPSTISAPHGVGFRVPGATALFGNLKADSIEVHVPTYPVLTAALSSRTTTTVTLGLTTLHGGSGVYTFQWASTITYNSGFSDIVGGTTETYVHTPADKEPRWYRCTVTDDIGQVVTSNQFCARPYDNAFRIGAVGSSTMLVDPTGAGSIPTRVGTRLLAWGGENTVTVTNQAVDGSQANQHLPGSASWDNTILPALVSANVQVVIFGWGVNDATAGRSAVNFAADCLAITESLKANGMKTVFFPIQCRNPSGGAGQDLSYAYHAARESLVDNVWVFKHYEDAIRWLITAQDPTLLVDGLHDDDTLHNYGEDWATEAVARALGLAESSLPFAQVNRGRLVNAGG